MQNQIPDNWQKVKLGDLTVKRGGVSGPFGSDIKSENFKIEGVPVIRGSNLTIHMAGGRFIDDGYVFLNEKKADELSKAEAISEDIILTARGTIGQTGIIPENSKFKKYIISANQLRFRLDKSKASPHFIYYQLSSKSVVKTIQNNSVNVGVPNFNLGAAKNIDIFMPKKIIDQEKIASTLSAFDDKIEVNNRIAKTLEEMAQSIFKEWFVKNKDDSWETKTIADVADTYGGGTPSTRNEEYWENGKINWATPTDMTALNGPIIFDTDKRITELGLKKSSATLLPEGTILLTSRATVGILAISKVPITTNQGFISVVPRMPFSSAYIYCWLTHNKKLIQGLATGSTFPEISRGVFRKIPIVEPNKEKIDAFNVIVNPVFEKIAITLEENQKLVALRDLLLPKLMKGEIRV